MARPDLEAVFVATPHHLHTPLVVQAAEAGKAVLVEKPLAESLASAREAVAATRKAGVPFSVCFCQRYQPVVQKAKALAEAGAVGDLLGTLLLLYEDKAAAYWSGGLKGGVVSGWRGSKRESGGGVLAMKAVHYFDLLRFLTGLEVAEVSATAATVEAPVEVEDSMSLWLRWSNGAPGAVHASFAVRGGGVPEDLRVWGKDGQLSLASPGQFYSLRMVGGKRSGQWHSMAPLPKMGDEMVEYVDRFAAALLEGRRPDIPGEEGLAVQAVLEAAYASAREGRPAKVER
jgi:predicted dehydrogenase